jgi:hypothetical protein
VNSPPILELRESPLNGIELIWPQPIRKIPGPRSRSRSLGPTGVASKRASCHSSDSGVRAATRGWPGRGVSASVAGGSCVACTCAMAARCWPSSSVRAASAWVRSVSMPTSTPASVRVTEPRPAKVVKPPAGLPSPRWPTAPTRLPAVGAQRSARALRVRRGAPTVDLCPGAQSVDYVSRGCEASARGGQYPTESSVRTAVV